MIAYPKHKLHIAITHHPSRKLVIKELLNPLDKEAKALGIADPYTIITDDRPNNTPSLVGREYVFMRAIASIPPDATHMLMLHDDIIICADFLKAVGQILAVRPTNALALYTPRKHVLKARARRLFWVKFIGAIWTQALIMPAAWWHEFIDFNKAAFLPGKFSARLRLICFLGEKHRQIYSPAPTLVDHLLPTKPLVECSNYKCRSKYFVPKNQSGCDFNWKNLRTVPNYARASARAILRDQRAPINPEYWGNQYDDSEYNQYGHKRSLDRRPLIKI